MTARHDKKQTTAPESVAPVPQVSRLQSAAPTRIAQTIHKIASAPKRSRSPDVTALGWRAEIR